jgi:hypothetical protein
MERAGFFMDHAAPHWDCVLEDFIGEAKLLKGMNAAGGEGEINRAAANRVTCARVGPAFIEINLTSALAEEGGEQASCEATTDKNKLGHDQNEPIRELNRGKSR